MSTSEVVAGAERGAIDFRPRLCVAAGTDLAELLARLPEGKVRASVIVELAMLGLALRREMPQTAAQLARGGAMRMDVEIFDPIAARGDIAEEPRGPQQAPPAANALGKAEKGPARPGQTLASHPTPDGTALASTRDQAIAPVAPSPPGAGPSPTPTRDTLAGLLMRGH